MKPMLACKWDPTFHEKMFPYWAQPKLDGIRVLVGDDGYLYTRSLKPVRNYHLQCLARNNPSLIGFDGEIIVGDPTAEDCYRRTSSAVMSYDSDDIENAKLYIFDVWKDTSSNYDQRYETILSLMDQFPDWVEVIPTVLLSDMRMLEEYEKKWLQQGYEGMMLRRRNGKYKKGRSTPKMGELIKLKRFSDEEGVVIACHEEMHNANPATINALGYTEHSSHKENLIGKGTLGSFELKLDEKKWASGTVRVGTGMSAKERQAFWRNRSNLIGKIVKFKYFEVGVKDAPRFPVFMGFRDKDDMDQGSLF